ncbi:Hypothetical predicted protein [Podarcis lilfordi]|uniref:Uncharacterized protein n=1 Tax=Podarcis lilfordi TaxID=74358 RepID=A0AA35NUU2_9SAUR|nr:Hypothetical predicted protein [Podarcis lilfordi]
MSKNCFAGKLQLAVGRHMLHKRLLMAFHLQHALLDKEKSALLILLSHLCHCNLIHSQTSAFLQALQGELAFVSTKGIWHAGLRASRHAQAIGITLRQTFAKTVLGGSH